MTLNATTGTAGEPDAYEINLTDAAGAVVKSLPAGTYKIVVHDYSTMHNFHLTGAGMDKATTVEEITTVTWTVTLARGTYKYVCDPHVPIMKGSFKVT